MDRIALVIGAAGGIGSETARALLAHGWRVRGLVRRPETMAATLPALRQVEWRAGDAMVAADVRSAAAGASLIVHAANPPGYKNWRGLALPMLANSIAAAIAVKARLVFPGNVYNFGADAGTVLREDAPQHPLTRKGAIRVEMEEMLAAAAGQGLRSLVVRAGDFFGPRAPGSWFANAFVKPGRPVRAITYPGVANVGHAWAFLPDLAETIARLADIESKLAATEVVHFSGHQFDRGIEMAEAIRRVVGEPVPIRRFPWPLVYVAAPFVALLREVLEMRYLWQRPLYLDNRKLVALIGAEPHTPLDQAVRLTLQGLGCLPSDAMAGSLGAGAMPRPAA